MTTSETPANTAPPAPTAAPDAASAANIQPITADAPQAQPDAGATAPAPTAPADQPKPAPSTLEQAAADINLALCYKAINQLRPRHVRPPPQRLPARPVIGIHDLLVEGFLNVTGHAGAVVEIPVSTMLSGTLSPAFIPLAQQQFETLLDQLLVKPATVAFISHIEEIKTVRKADVEKAKHARAAAFEREQEAQRELLNRKGTSL